MIDNREDERLAKQRENWHKFAHAKEIVPDSEDLEVAYWESFKSEWPMQQYRNGVHVCDIARAHHRSTDSLRRFFRERYGAKWHLAPKPEPKRKSRYKTNACHKAGSTVRNEQIVSLLCEGWRPSVIARLFDVSPEAIRHRIRTYNLREVAANDTYKPAYAAA